MPAGLRPRAKAGVRTLTRPLRPRQVETLSDRWPLAGSPGFTLIEVLVVILIIGILAAIAVPLFVQQSIKAEDSVAKSNARSLTSEVEACFAIEREYDACDEEAELNGEGDIGLPLGTAPGEVAVTDAGPEDFTVTATSTSEHGSRLFAISRTSGDPASRSCEPEGGGCDGNTW